jgi:hypothetical protein
MTDQPNASVRDVCCGEKYCGANRPDMAGQPLILACQLCPKSPSYWRRPQDGTSIEDDRERVTR